MPLPAGCGDDEYVAAFTDLIAPVAPQFRPEFVLISAGFDADHRDPLGRHAGDRGGLPRDDARADADRRTSTPAAALAAILEGGYDLRALRAAVPAVLDELGGRRSTTALATPQPRGPVLAPARAAQTPYWELPE